MAVLIDAKKGHRGRGERSCVALADSPRAEDPGAQQGRPIDKPALLALTQTLNANAKFAATFMISALSGDGVADLKAWFAAHVPPGPWLYPEDQMSDAPLRQLAAEITREKLYLRLHQELPYQSTVETEVWKESRDGSVRIEQTIYVERESQRKIVLGKGGQAIKAIGAAARAEIAKAVRTAGASVPAREGAGRLGRRSGTLSRNGAGIPEGNKTVHITLMEWTDDSIVLGVKRHGETQRHSRTDDAWRMAGISVWFGAARLASARRAAAGQCGARDLAGAAR